MKRRGAIERHLRKAANESDEAQRLSELYRVRTLLNQEIAEQELLDSASAERAELIELLVNDEPLLSHARDMRPLEGR